MTEKQLSPAAMALVQSEGAADEKRRFHEAMAEKYKRARNEIRDALAVEMGDATEGIYEGRIVMRRTPTEQFAKAEFRKDHPDIWEEVKVANLTYDVDLAKLKEIDEDLAAKYSTVRWYNDSWVSQ